MQRVVKRRLTFLLAGTIIAVSYLLFRCHLYDYQESAIIKNVAPANVWEYVADFGNMKHLNPTIVEFDILSESGNYNRWQYSAEYTENLSHWPYLSNRAVAHFDVSSEHGTYFIVSNHHTCMLGGLLCRKYCTGASSVRITGRFQ
uniref:Uncharacterized protein n=1 Tax=Photinus pyralis TaxID=7054 RepID=A0A1Y1M6L1_PHOPY